MELKSPYTSDGKYLAVITKNGLWIKDVIDEKILITNASKIEKNFLINSFVSEFDKNFNVIKNYKSEKIDIRNNNWLIINPRIYEKNNYQKVEEIRLKTNFDYQKILSLYSNLSSLSLFELYELRKNYIKLNISITEVNLQMLKIVPIQFFYFYCNIFALIMFRVKQINGNTYKIV